MSHPQQDESSWENSDELYKIEKLHFFSHQNLNVFFVFPLTSYCCSSLRNEEIETLSSGAACPVRVGGGGGVGFTELENAGAVSNPGSGT